MIFWGYCRTIRGNHHVVYAVLFHPLQTLVILLIFQWHILIISLSCTNLCIGIAAQSSLCGSATQRCSSNGNGNEGWYCSNHIHAKYTFNIWFVTNELKLWRHCAIFFYHIMSYIDMLTKFEAWIISSCKSLCVNTFHAQHKIIILVCLCHTWQRWR